MSSAEVVTKAEYARMRGVADSYVSKLARKGRLVLTADGRVRVAESDALIAATRDPSRGGKRAHGPLVQPGSVPTPAWAAEAPPAQAAGPVASPASPAASGGPQGQPASEDGVVVATTYADAQRLHKVELVRRARLTIAREAGALVPAEDVKRLAFERSRAAQAALLSIPDRLCLGLAAETDPERCHALLLAEIRKVCAELAGPAAVAAHAPEVAA